MIRLLTTAAMVALSACGLKADPEVVARECEERARAAQGPTGSVSVGINNRNGPFAGFEIGVNSDFLRGLDPYAVYDRCVFDRTGELPIRPPVLRNL